MRRDRLAPAGGPTPAGGHRAPHRARRHPAQGRGTGAGACRPGIGADGSRRNLRIAPDGRVPPPRPCRTRRPVLAPGLRRPGGRAGPCRKVAGEQPGTAFPQHSRAGRLRLLCSLPGELSRGRGRLRASCRHGGDRPAQHRDHAFGDCRGFHRCRASGHTAADRRSVPTAACSRAATCGTAAARPGGEFRDRGRRTRPFRQLVRMRRGLAGGSRRQRQAHSLLPRPQGRAWTAILRPSSRALGGEAAQCHRRRRSPDQAVQLCAPPRRLDRPSRRPAREAARRRLSRLMAQDASRRSLASRGRQVRTPEIPGAHRRRSVARQVCGNSATLGSESSSRPASSPMQASRPRSPDCAMAFWFRNGFPRG